jgi:hypothetical protein
VPIFGRWQNPAILTRNRKVAYRSMAIAEKSARRASERAGELIIAYECCDCGRFHIGHANKSQIIVRERLERRLHNLPTSCPRCGSPIPEERRLAAWESGNRNVYCSKKCQQKGGKKLRHARRTIREAEFTEWLNHHDSDRMS